MRDRDSHLDSFPDKDSLVNRLPTLGHNLENTHHLETDILMILIIKTNLQRLFVYKNQSFEASIVRSL